MGSNDDFDFDGPRETNSSFALSNQESKIRALEHQVRDLKTKYNTQSRLLESAESIKHVLEAEVDRVRRELTTALDEIGVRDQNIEKLREKLRRSHEKMQERRTAAKELLDKLQAEYEKELQDERKARAAAEAAARDAELKLAAAGQNPGALAPQPPGSPARRSYYGALGSPAPHTASASTGAAASAGGGLSSILSTQSEHRLLELAHAEIHELRSRLREAEDRTRSLEATLATRATEYDKELRARDRSIAALEARATASSDAANKMRNELERARVDIDRARGETEKALREFEREREQERQDFERERQEYDRERQDYEDRFAEVTAELQRLEREKTTVAGELRALRDEQRAKARTEKERGTGALRGALASLRPAGEVAETLAETLESQHETLREERDRRREAEAEIDHLTQRLNAMATDVDRLSERLERRERDLDAAQDELRRARDAREFSRAGSRGRSPDADQRLVEELRVARAERDETAAELDRVAHQLEDLRAKSEQVQFAGEASLAEHGEDLRRQKRDLRETESRLRTSEAERELADARAEAAGNRIEELETRLSELRRRSVDNDARNRSAADAAVVAAGELAAEQQKRRAADARAETAEATLKAREKDFEARTAELRKRTEAAEAALQGVSRRGDDDKDRSTAAQRRSEEDAERLRVAQRRADLAESRMQDWAAKAEDADARVRQLRAEIESDADVQRVKLRAAEERAENAEMRLTTVERRLRDATERAEDAERRADDAERGAHAARENLSLVKARLDESRAEASTHRHPTVTDGEAESMRRTLTAQEAERRRLEVRLGEYKLAERHLAERLRAEEERARAATAALENLQKVAAQLAEAPRAAEAAGEEQAAMLRMEIVRAQEMHDRQAAASAETMIALREQADDERMRRRQADERVDAAEHDLELVRTRLAGLERENSELQTDGRRSADEARRLRAAETEAADAKKELAREIEKGRALQRELAEARAVPDDRATRAKLSAEVEASRVELRRQVEAAQKFQDHAAELQRVVDAQNERLEAATAAKAVLGDVWQELKNEKERAQSLADQLQEMRRASDAQNERVAGAQGVRDAVEGQLRKMAADLESTEATVLRLRDELQKAHEAIDRQQATSTQMLATIRGQYDASLNDERRRAEAELQRRREGDQRIAQAEQELAAVRYEARRESERMRELREDFDKLQGSVESHKERVRAAEGARDVVEGQLKKVSAALEVSEDSVRRLTEELRRAHDSVDRHHSSSGELLGTLRSQYESSANEARLRMEEERLRRREADERAGGLERELESTRKLLAAREQDASRAQQDSARLREAELRNAAVGRDAEREKERAAILEDQVRELQAQKERFTQHLTAAEQEVSVARRELAAERDRMRRLDAEVVALRQESDRGGRIADAALESEAAAMRQQLETERVALAALRREYDKLQTSAQAAALTAVEEARRGMVTAENARREIAELEQRLQDTELELERLRRGAGAEVGELRVRFEAAERALREIELRGEGEAARMQAERDAVIATEEAHAAGVVALRTKIGALEAERARAEDEAVRSALAIAELEERVREREAALSVALSDVRERDNAIAALVPLNAPVPGGVAGTAVQTARDAVAAAERKAALEASLHRAARAQCDDATAELTTARAKIDTQERALRAEEARRRDAEAALAVAREDLSQAKNLLSACQAELARCQTALGDTTTRLARAETERGRLEMRTSLLEGHEASVSEESRRAEAKVKVFEDEARQLRVEVERTREALARREADLAGLQAETAAERRQREYGAAQDARHLDSLQDYIRVLEGEKTALVDQVQHLAADNREHVLRIQEGNIDRAEAAATMQQQSIAAAALEMALSRERSGSEALRHTVDQLHSRLGQTDAEAAALEQRLLRAEDAHSVTADRLNATRHILSSRTARLASVERDALAGRLTPALPASPAPQLPGTPQYSAHPALPRRAADLPPPPLPPTTDTAPRRRGAAYGAPANAGAETDPLSMSDLGPAHRDLGIHSTTGVLVRARRISPAPLTLSNPALLRARQSASEEDERGEMAQAREDRLQRALAEAAVLSERAKMRSSLRDTERDKGGTAAADAAGRQADRHWSPSAFAARLEEQHRASLAAPLWSDTSNPVPVAPLPAPTAVGGGDVLRRRPYF